MKKEKQTVRGFEIISNSEHTIFRQKYILKDRILTIIGISIIALILYTIYTIFISHFDFKNLLISIIALYALYWAAKDTTRLLYNPKLGLLQIDRKNRKTTIRKAFNKSKKINNQNISEVCCVINSGNGDNITGWMYGDVRLIMKDGEEISCFAIKDKNIFIRKNEKIFRQIAEIAETICSRIAKELDLKQYHENKNKTD